MLKITIISDNTTAFRDLKSEWGFSALIEVENTPLILFDTGADSQILLHNMEKLKISPKSIQCVFISHSHWDHTGGLRDFLKLNPEVKLYVPEDFSDDIKAKEIIKVKDSTKIYENVFSTGTLKGIEQSLVIKKGEEVVIIVGCSHSGVGEILKESEKFGRPKALIGGLHGFSEFSLIKDLDLICATHCTQYKDKIKELYPEKFIEGGAGRVIEI